MKDSKNVKIVLSGIIFGMLFWFFDSIIDAYAFDDGNLFKQIFHPTLLELWIRLLVLGIILSFIFLFTRQRKAEGNLKASFAFLQSVVDGVAEPIMVIGTDYRVKLMNRAARESLPESSRKSGSLLCHQVSHNRDTPCDGMQHACPLEQVKKSGRSVTVVHEHKQNGEARFIEILASPLYGEDGTFQGIIESLRDVTERKRAEETLKLFSEAVENAPDGVQITDVGGNILYSNRAVEEIYGFSPSEFKGKHVNEMNVDPEFASNVILPGIKERGHWAGELMVKHKDGGAFPVWLAASMVKDSKGEPIAMVGIIRDITERKRIEEALRQSEERYRSLFENSPISLWEEDSSGVKKYIDSLRGKGIKDFRAYFEHHPEVVALSADMVKVIDVNKATVEVFKARSKGEIIASLSKIFTEKSYKVFREELIAIADGKTAFESEDIVRTLAGDEIHINLRWSVVPGYEETYSKRLVSIIDITERQRAEEAIKKYSRELEESNRIKELFTDIMHHDLLNPLNISKGYIELLREEETDTRLEIIERNLTKGMELIENATMLSKLESLESIEFEDLDLKDVIENAAENLGSLADKAGMKIEINISQSLPARANRIIEEVFVNFISNAIKYASKGKKIVVAADDMRSAWKIKVIDFGEGIKDEDKTVIFERFRRMEKKGVKGSGLGLAIAKKIVELHSGRIWVENNPDGGAVFAVEIPKSQIE